MLGMDFFALGESGKGMIAKSFVTEKSWRTVLTRNIVIHSITKVSHIAHFLMLVKVKIIGEKAPYSLLLLVQGIK